MLKRNKRAVPISGDVEALLHMLVRMTQAAETYRAIADGSATVSEDERAEADAVLASVQIEFASELDLPEEEMAPRAVVPMERLN